MRKFAAIVTAALSLCASGSDWPAYRHDHANSGHASASGGTIHLQKGWTYRADSRITSTPSVAGTLVYVGTWKGDVLALDAARGTFRWRSHLGANPDEVYGGPRGVIGSISIASGIAYAASGNCTVAALDANDRAPRWRASVCDVHRNDDVYASPVVADGLVLIGVNILADRPTDRGREVALDEATGKTRWTLQPALYAGMGSGISATPAVDDASGTAYVGTGNPLPMRAPPPGDDPGSDSIIAINVKSGTVRWSFGPVHPHDASDEDFFASPSRFNIGSPTRPRWVIGEGNKDATYYAVDARSGAPLWRCRIPGARGSASIIGTGAVAGNAIFVPLYDGSRGSLTALRASDGAVLWQRRTGGEYEAPLVWGSSVFTTETGGWLDELAAGTGMPLDRWRICAPALGRGPSAGTRALYVASGNCLTYFSETK